MLNGISLFIDFQGHQMKVALYRGLTQRLYFESNLTIQVIIFGNFDYYSIIIYIKLDYF